jgi:hypothetical protein
MVAVLGMVAWLVDSSFISSSVEAVIRSDGSQKKNNVFWCL